MIERESTKVLLDTDIGTNIDDALCLAYLLAQPACRLLGVTTVTDRADEHLDLVGEICGAAGAEPDRASSGRDAVALMWRLVQTHPGEIELLAIGPTTNVARLFDTYPDAPAMLRGLTLMCGSFGRGVPGRESPERNARTDPRATAAVYASSVRSRSVGLNVTRRVVASQAAISQMLSCEPWQPVLSLAEQWFQTRVAAGGDGGTDFRGPQAALNDPLAAVTVFVPSICAFERGTVEVAAGSAERSGRVTPRGAGELPIPAGTTIWWPGGRDAPHEVAVDVDPGACMRHLQATFDLAGDSAGEDR